MANHIIIVPIIRYVVLGGVDLIYAHWHSPKSLDSLDKATISTDG